MLYFADISLAELTPIFALMASMLVGFYALVKYMLNQADKAAERNTKAAEADRVERKALAEAITKMADPEINGNRAIADGIVKQANESAERNGHLGELILQQGEQTARLTDMAVAKVIEGVQNVTTQNVIKQNVKSSTVKDETIEHETVKSKE